MTYLHDVNVWIALAGERHTHNLVARNWFSNLHDEKLFFCRLTQLGFLRLLTNKHVMQEEVMKLVGGNLACVANDHHLHRFAGCYSEAKDRRESDDEHYSREFEL